MTVRLTARQPARGSGIDAPDEVPPSSESIAYTSEDDWGGHQPATYQPTEIVIVDGTYRVDARGLDRSMGQIMSVLWGSVAVGAVICGLDYCDVPDKYLWVTRRLLHSRPSMEDFEIVSGGVTLNYQAHQVQEDAPSGLVGALPQLMLAEESRLASELARSHEFVMIDGSLHQHRLDSFSSAVVGYTKSIRQWYVDRDRIDALATIPVGERSPLFILDSAGDGGRWKRYSWFVPLARMPRHIEQLSGLARLEVSASIGEDHVRRIADQTAVQLPQLASELGDDPRAPQNLIPVGALEDDLRHALSEDEWIYREIESAVAERELNDEHS